MSAVYKGFTIKKILKGGVEVKEICRNNAIIWSAEASREEEQPSDAHEIKEGDTNDAS